MSVIDFCRFLYSFQFGMRNQLIIIVSIGTWQRKDQFLFLFDVTARALFNKIQIFVCHMPFQLHKFCLISPISLLIFAERKLKENAFVGNRALSVGD